MESNNEVMFKSYKGQMSDISKHWKTSNGARIYFDIVSDVYV